MYIFLKIKVDALPLPCYLCPVCSVELWEERNRSLLLILSSGSIASCLSQYKGSITPLAAQAPNLRAILDFFLLHSVCNLPANRVSSTSEIYLLSTLFFTGPLTTPWLKSPSSVSRIIIIAFLSVSLLALCPSQSSLV